MYFLQPKSLLPTTCTGVYEIRDVCSHEDRAFLQAAPEKMNVRCEMDTNGGGWIVIQRRISGGTTNFNQNWTTYEKGFGDLEGEFWFGLRNIHCLTTREEVELRVDMQTTAGVNISWTYQEFQVDGPEDNYRLHVGQGEKKNGPYTFDGINNAESNNQSFSTYDRDNDGSGNHCAKNLRGGWWYRSCTHALLNSPHGPLPLLRLYTGPVSRHVQLSNVEMKVRPKTCTPTTEQCD